MATSKQIAKGIATWIDAEMLPMMRGAGKYGAGMASVLLLKRGEMILDQGKELDAVKLMGLVRNGEYDLDLIREVMLQPFPAEGMRLEASQINNAINRFLGKLGPILNIQVEGSMTFHKFDLEKLFGYIAGG